MRSALLSPIVAAPASAMLLPSFSDPHLFSALCPPRTQSTFENGGAPVCVSSEAGLLRRLNKKEPSQYHSNLETVKALYSSSVLPHAPDARSPGRSSRGKA